VVVVAVTRRTTPSTDSLLADFDPQQLKDPRKVVFKIPDGPNKQTTNYSKFITSRNTDRAIFKILLPAHYSSKSIIG